MLKVDSLKPMQNKIGGWDCKRNQYLAVFNFMVGCSIPLLIQLEQFAFKLTHYKNKMVEDFHMVGIEHDVYPINVQS